MKCPSCREALPALAAHCPGCGAMVAPPTEGALAPKPRTVTPASRDKVEPLRDIPGMPKKERTWRDEVQERVSKRRKKRTQSSLPLFEQTDVVGATQPASAPATTSGAPAHAGASETEQVSPPPVEKREAPPLRLPTAALERTIVDHDFESTPLSEDELADLPLRESEAKSSAPRDQEPRGVPVERNAETPSLDEELVPADEDDEQVVSLNPPLGEAAPLERPARISERAQAAAVDAGILAVLGSLVIYFAGRAARVDAASLLVSWPWMLSYLSLLGIFYAGYFTGTTGQTPGKMIARLRVVDSRGRPPGYLRATLRAMAGAAGTLLAGLGLVPMALDPARRALHDRLLHTRVIHR